MEQMTLEKPDERPLLVGELNPYGADPEFALYPLPPQASGGRLQRLMGLSVDEYLERFRRANLCTLSWSMASARAAAQVWKTSGSRAFPIVLLGARVATAFKLDFRPFSRRRRFVVLPHPSGRNHVWNDEASRARLQQVLREAGVL